MVRKRKASAIVCILVACLIAATARAQADILVFNDTTGLPTCAYDCQDLYSAQYECPGGGNRVDCFCSTGYITSKPQGWGCDDACKTDAEKARVVSFLSATCGTAAAKDDKDDKKDAKEDDETSGSNKNPTTSANKPGTDPQAEKALNWWRKNWPYFFLAFMLVAIAILVMAFAGPVRKYVRRRVIGRRARHSGQGVPPYWEPSAPASVVSSAYPPNERFSAAAAAPYGHGRADSRTPRRDQHLSGGSMAYDRVPGPSPTLTSPTPPGIRTLFATHAAAEPSTRQESWERRIRQEHEGKGWFGGGSRLAFWRRGGRAGEAEKQYSSFNPGGGRAV